MKSFSLFLDMRLRFAKVFAREGAVSFLPHFTKAYNMKKNTSKSRSRRPSTSSRRLAEGRNKSLRTRSLGLEQLEDRSLLSAVGVGVFPASTASEYVQTVEAAPAEPIDLSGLSAPLAAEPLSSTGASLVVTTLNDVVDSGDGVLSLREALAAAQNGDTVTFGVSGSVVLSGTNLEINKSITVDATSVWDSQNDAPGITVDGDASSRVFAVTGDSVALKGIKITNGYVNSQLGGGLAGTGLELTLERCVVTGNVSANMGAAGGVGVYDCSLTVLDSVISNNTARMGGGLYFANGQRDVELTVINSEISGNTGSDGSNPMGGGGVLLSGASGTSVTANFIGSSIVGNAGTEGGGFYCNGYGSLTLANCSVSANTAYSSYFGIGGAFRTSPYFSLSLTDCTVAGNAASSPNNFGYGGGLYAGDVELRNTIVALNSPDDVHLNGSTVAYNSLSSFSRWTDGANNLVYDSSQPLFVDAENGDFSLAANSQAIDRGNDAYVSTQFDLAGRRRFYGSSVDIGAYEYQLPETPSTVVTTLDDTVNAYDDLVSLREAIAYAQDGDTVTFAVSGAVVLSGTQLNLNKSITVDATSVWDAENDAPGVTVDGDGKSRVFLATGESAALKGLKITNGNSDSYGGGVYTYSNEMTISDCVISDNRARGKGGGVYSSRASLTVVNTTVSGNTAYGSAVGGGGIGVSGGAVNLSNCVISNNAVEEVTNALGGGVLVDGGYEGAHLTVSNCVVSNNSAFNGGGIYMVSGSNNPQAATLTVSNSVIADNTASYIGGGLAASGTGTASITSSTITNNSAGAYCDGLYLSFTSAELYNTIVAMNSVLDFYGWGTLKAYNTLTTYTDWTEGANNLVYDPTQPLFVDADNGDYRLAPNSQAYNAGSNEYVAGETDVAGKPRESGASVDIGAYELQPSLSFNAYSKTVTALVDQNVVLTRGVEAVGMEDPTYSVKIDGVKSTKITVNKKWGQIVYSGGINGLPAREEPYAVTVMATDQYGSVSKEFLLTVVNDSAVSLKVSTNSPKYNTAVRATLKPTAATVTYQWYRTKNAADATAVWTAISGATKATYVPTDADLGYYLKVVARGTGDYAGHATQAITTGKATRAIVSVTLPTTVEVNKTLTAYLSPSAATATYQWYRGSDADGWTAIKNATGVKYVPQLADVGKYLKVVASGKDNYTGSAFKATSKPVTASLVSVSFSGKLRVGSTVTSYLSPSAATVTYQWYSSSNGSSWTEITDATSKSYTPTDAEAGKYLRVVIKGTGFYKGTLSKTTASKISAVASAPSAQDAFIGYEDAVLDEEFGEFWNTLEETLNN